MARDALRPGLSMPVALKKQGASSASPMMKSPESSWARRPQKEVITFLKGMEEVVLRASFEMNSRSSAVVAVSSLGKVSVLLGPIIKLPWTVGVTRTPFPFSEGSWNMVVLNMPFVSPSKSI